MKHDPFARHAATFLRVHVPIKYILGPKRGSHIVALGAKYILYRYMDP